jgi:hypothetical protein
MMETALTNVVSVRERTPGDRLAAAATRLYDAEIALHIARQTAVDAWVAAAYRRLHAAVCEHRAALFATEVSVGHRSCGHQRHAS